MRYARIKSAEQELSSLDRHFQRDPTSEGLALDLLHLSQRLGGKKTAGMNAHPVVFLSALETLASRDDEGSWLVEDLWYFAEKVGRLPAVDYRIAFSVSDTSYPIVCYSLRASVYKRGVTPWPHTSPLMTAFLSADGEVIRSSFVRENNWWRRHRSNYDPRAREFMMATPLNEMLKMIRNASIWDGNISTRMNPVVFNNFMFPEPRFHHRPRESYTQAQWKNVLRIASEYPCIVTLFFSQRNNHPIFQNLVAMDRERLLEWAKQV